MRLKGKDGKISEPRMTSNVEKLKEKKGSLLWALATRIPLRNIDNTGQYLKRRFGQHKRATKYHLKVQVRPSYSLNMLRRVTG